MSRTLLAGWICLAGSGLGAKAPEFTSRQPLSLLSMVSEVKQAAHEYLSMKESRRVLQASDTGDANGDEEIIIDPSADMPDSWDDEDADFLEPIQDDSSECVRTLVDLTNNFMSYNDIVMHIFRNSGKDYNDFGRFEDCQQIHEFNYFMVTVLKKFPIPFTMGLCLPKQCQVDDLNDFKPFLAKAINAAVPNMFEGV